MGLLLIHHHILQNIAVCWEDSFMCLKLITICTRKGDITELVFQTDEQNILCLNWDFSRLLKIWLVLPWLAENWNWNEFRGINKFDYFFTPVSRGNSSRSIFSHYFVYTLTKNYLNFCKSKGKDKAKPIPKKSKIIYIYF